MKLMNILHENGKLTRIICDDTVNKLKKINKNAKVVWSFGRWKNKNSRVCRILKYGRNQDSEMHHNDAGIWVWVVYHSDESDDTVMNGRFRDLYVNKEIAILLVECIPIGDQALDLELGYVACLLSNSLLWNMDEEQHGGLDDMKNVFSFILELKKDLEEIRSNCSGSVDFNGPAIQVLDHNNQNGGGSEDKPLERYLNDTLSDSESKLAFKDFFGRKGYFRLSENESKELQNLIFPDCRSSRTLMGFEFTVKSFATIVQTYVSECNQGASTSDLLSKVGNMMFQMSNHPLHVMIYKKVSIGMIMSKFLHVKRIFSK